jgi:hypothetical protein
VGMGWLVTLVVATALGLGGGAHDAPVALRTSTPRAHHVVFGTEASNKALAETQAERELDSVAVPPAARPVDEAPAPRLAEALGTRGEPNLVQRWKYFVASGTVAGTLAWFRAHPPAHSYLEMNSGGNAIESLWFSVAEHSRRVYGPNVIPIVGRLAAHRVGIRLEVQQVWKTPHPAAAKVPAAARLLQVSRWSAGERQRWQTIRLPRRVRHLAHVINQLPAAQPQILYGCLEYPEVKRVEVRMLFRARKGGPVLAEAAEHMPPEMCESMSLKVAGDPRTFALEGGPEVIDSLRR